MLRRRRLTAESAEPDEPDEPDTTGSGRGRAQPVDEPARDRAEVEVVDDLPPSTMRGTEPMYGYLVALELAVVAVLNLVVVHGKGAPKHPSRPMEFVGLAAAFGLVGLLQTRNRFLVGFATMVVTLLVVLPRVPTSLVVVHFVALMIAFFYGYTLTRRQSKARLAQPARRRDGSEARARRQTAAERRAETLARQQERRAKRKGLVAPTGPKPSGRYTPPKPRRARPRS